jgi:SAM-dependent methyltransferase
MKVSLIFFYSLFDSFHAPYRKKIGRTMSYKNDFYPESKFGGFSNIDGTIAFYSRINALLASTSIVLDVGCGRGIYDQDLVIWRRNLRILKGKGKKVIGLDVDPAAKENPCINEFRLLDSDRWPVDDESIDLVVCDNVLEHLKDPVPLFKEANRVLQRGGYVCIRTPNSLNYIALFSRLIPNKYHSKVTAVVQDSRKEEDVFPTYYRCNTVTKIRSMMKRYGFGINVVYGYEAEPSYFKASVVAFGRKGDQVA